MRAVAAARWPWILPFVALVGCAELANRPEPGAGFATAASSALAQRNTELQTRAQALDKDNQELQTMLGQSQQQSRVLEDQMTALRDQLGSATSQLAKVKEQTPPGGKGPEAWTVSTKSQAGARSRPIAA